MQVTPGPDGFVATSGAADYRLQVLLTDYLRERQTVGGAALEQVLPRVRKELSKRELVALICATHRRIAWIADHEHELSEPRHWQGLLAKFARNLYSPKLPCTAEELILCLEAHRKYRTLWPFGPEEMLLAFLDTHDMPPQLVDELRRFRAELKGGSGSAKYQSQASYQVAVQHVHMLLWHDERGPLDPSRCWSDLVRRDFRAMTGARRENWKALFCHIKGNAPAKPAKGWIEEAEARLTNVGREDFHNCFCAWFAQFASSEPQALTVAGSHILRGLLWFAALAKDPDLAQCALSLLDTTWKAKRNVDKVMVALVSVLETLPPAEAWPSLLRLQQEWATTSGQIERLFKDTAAKLDISEDELKARALLKPPIDITAHVTQMMDKLLDITEEELKARTLGKSGVDVAVRITQMMDKLRGVPRRR